MNFVPLPKDRRERPHPIGELTSETPPCARMRLQRWEAVYRPFGNDEWLQAREYTREAMATAQTELEC